MGDFGIKTCYMPAIMRRGLSNHYSRSDVMATHFRDTQYREPRSTRSQRPVINPHVFSRHCAGSLLRVARCLPSCCFMLYGIAGCLNHQRSEWPTGFAIASSPLRSLILAISLVLPSPPGIVASTWNCSALSAATTPTAQFQQRSNISLTSSVIRTKRAASW